MKGKAIVNEHGPISGIWGKTEKDTFSGIQLVSQKNWGQGKRNTSHHTQIPATDLPF